MCRFSRPRLHARQLTRLLVKHLQTDFPEAWLQEQVVGDFLLQHRPSQLLVGFDGQIWASPAIPVWTPLLCRLRLRRAVRDRVIRRAKATFEGSLSK
jgi:hypothetical protein